MQPTTHAVTKTPTKDVDLVLKRLSARPTVALLIASRLRRARLRHLDEGRVHISVRKFSNLEVTAWTCSWRKKCRIRMVRLYKTATYTNRNVVFALPSNPLNCKLEILKTALSAWNAHPGRLLRIGLQITTNRWLNTARTPGSIWRRSGESPASVDMSHLVGS